MGEPRAPVDDERGAVLVFTALVIVVLLGMTALVVDMGRLFVVRAELQNAADSAAVAAASELPDPATAQVIALDYAALQHDGPGVIATPTDVEVGNWDYVNETFTANATPLNAVQVVTRRTAAYGNDVENFFGAALGIARSNVSAIAVASKRLSVIDFEGLPAGTWADTVSVGSGVSGDDVGGTVTVTTTSGFGPMVFDATCGGGPPSNCSGGDSDLYAPAQGGVLINSEDGDQSDPDDLGACTNGNNPPASVTDPADVTEDCAIVFDFRGFGTGLVTVERVTLVDVEEDAFVWLYRDGALVATVTLDDVLDGQTAIRAVPGAPAADMMVVKLQGSGAVDDIGYSEIISLVQ